MPVARFAYLAPRSVSEAVAALAGRHGDARVLAGGTDLLPKLGKGSLAIGAVVSLRHVAELRAIAFDRERGLTIGATARLNELIANEAVRALYPAIAHAASQTATVQIRNMATVAGNICNGSPCADNVPTLIARGARVELASGRGTRMLDLAEVFLGPSKTALAPDELLVRIHVPPPPKGTGTAYRCISARSKVDVSSVSVAAHVACEDGTIREARIVLGAVGPTPLRATKAEELLAGRKLTDELLAAAGDAAAAASRPISDVRASASWRRRMVGVLAKRAIADAVERANGKAGAAR